MAAPGVYIEESASLSLSVRSGATTVPVFVGNFKEKADFVKPGGTSDRCIAIANWLDFTARFEGPTAAKVTVKLEATDKVADWEKEQTQAWAEKLATQATERAVKNGKLIKSQVKEKLQTLLGTSPNPKEWVEKETKDLVEVITPDLQTAWKTAVDAELTKAADDVKNFPTDTATTWIGKWIDKALQQAWQEFKTDPVEGKKLKEAMGALTGEKVAATAIPADVTKRLKVGGVTTVAGAPAFISESKVHLITVDAAEVNLNYGAFALQHYFSNGGTGCYLVKLEAGNAPPSTLAQEIQKYPDISLLVCPEPVVESGGMTLANKKAVYTALGGLLNKQQGYFLLADGDESPDTTLAQTAVYHPNLVTTFQPSLPAAEDISFSDQGDKLKKLTLANMTGSAFDKFRQEVMTKVEAAFQTIKAKTPQIILPPSAAVAGAYARTDLERGVWKAPANVPLNAVKRVETIVTDTEQGKMNEEGINVIRTFTGQGTMIWGARTLDVKSDNWRYIPVRRLFNAAERDIKRAMQFAVFEANSAPTWESVRSAIENYLYSLWRQGALMGNSEKEAYFVQIGKDITMTEGDIKDGRMIVKVGMAAVRPAEFIIVQFTQNVV